MGAVGDYEVVVQEEGTPEIGGNSYTVDAPSGKVILAAGVKRASSATAGFQTVMVEVSNDGTSAELSISYNGGTPTPDIIVWATVADMGGCE